MNSNCVNGQYNDNGNTSEIGVARVFLIDIRKKTVLETITILDKL